MPLSRILLTVSQRMETAFLYLAKSVSPMIMPLAPTIFLKWPTSWFFTVLSKMSFLTTTVAQSVFVPAAFWYLFGRMPMHWPGLILGEQQCAQEWLDDCMSQSSE